MEAFTNSTESRTLYGRIDNNITDIINGIYLALFNRNADEAGRNFYINGFMKGTFTPATIMLNILDGAQNDDLAILKNKLAAADLFTKMINLELSSNKLKVIYQGNRSAIAARHFLSLVTSDSATIPTHNQTTEYIRTYMANPNNDILAPERLIG